MNMNEDILLLRKRDRTVKCSQINVIIIYFFPINL